MKTQQSGETGRNEQHHNFSRGREGMKTHFLTGEQHTLLGGSEEGMETATFAGGPREEECRSRTHLRTNH